MEMYSSIVRSEAQFSRDKKRTHRYILKKIWNVEKPVATIIMLNPRMQTDALFQDKSVVMFMNYCISENFGGLYIVNLFSYRCDSEEKLKAINYNKRFDTYTDKWIAHAVNNSVKLYIGWGSNRNRIKRIDKIKEILRKCNDIEIVRLNTIDGKAVHISRSTLMKMEVLVTIDQI